MRIFRVISAGLLLAVVGVVGGFAAEEKAEKSTDYEKSRYISPAVGAQFNYVYDQYGEPVVRPPEGEEKKAGRKKKKKRKKISRKPGKRSPKSSRKKTSRSKTSPDEREEADDQEESGEGEAEENPRGDPGRAKTKKKAKVKGSRKRSAGPRQRLPEGGVGSVFGGGKEEGKKEKEGAADGEGEPESNGGVTIVP